ncbi:MAG: hypothetical protein IIV95_06740 [Burkholderiaceae bacterium]|jgi:hypothetical protein|nr:hypothetical protein [Burkholderiaceae bacterium]
MSELIELLHLGEAGWYVLLTTILGIVLVIIELFSLKNRRRRAYQTLIREARARRSEMNLLID